MKEWKDKVIPLNLINFAGDGNYTSIKRAIQKYVEDAVADAILDGVLKEGKTYTVSKDKKENKLTIK